MMSQRTEVACKLTVLQSEMKKNCISKNYLNSFRCFYIIVGTQLTCMRTFLMELLVNILTYLHLEDCQRHQHENVCTSA